MADHVCDQVASPEIDSGQDGAEGESENHVGPAVGPVGEGEDQQRDATCQITIEAKRLKPFDGVAAIEKFFDHAGAQDDENNQPEWELRQSFSSFAASEMGEAGNDAADQAAEHHENSSPEDRAFHG